MNQLWQKGRIGLAGLALVTIAVAATSERSPQEANDGGVRNPEQSPTVTAVKTPAKLGAVQVDMTRLRRLLPARDADLANPANPTDPANETAVVNGAENSTPSAEDKVIEVPVRAEIVNAFASKSWYVPPPPPPPPKIEPPPKPTAPPLPFVYIGRYDNPGAPTVIMLVRGDRLYTVSEGDSIDGTYHVDRVEKGQVELTYLPLKQKQFLQTGAPG